MLFASASSGFAQTKPAPADAAGRRVLRVHDGPAARDARATAPARPPRISAPSGSTRRRRKFRPRSPSCTRASTGRPTRSPPASAPSRRTRRIPRPTGFSAACTRGCRKCRPRGRPTGAPTRSARLRTSRKPIATRIRACRRCSGACTSRTASTTRRSRCSLPFVTDQPDQVEAVAMLAEAYQATDRDAEAIALLEKSVQDAPELYSTLGQVYQDAGRWSDAARAFAGAVEERPQSLPLRSQWATALLNVGDAAARARSARRRIGGQLAQSARVVSAVRSAAPHARFRGRRSDRAPPDRARCARARRTAPARADLPRPERAPEDRGAARADRDGAPRRGGRRRSLERHVPQHLLRSRDARTRSCGSSTRRSRC